MRRDYYEVLEIKSGASAVEIRRAYQRLARQYSPDVNLWEREAQALYSEIGEAYRVLSNPIARALYDRQGAPRVERAGPDETTGRERATGRRGDDLHLPVELSFQQAVSGLELELPVHRLSPCVDCGATGTDRTAPPVPCTHCRGVGVLWQGGGESPSPADCPACGGAGRRIAAPCRACRGRGVKPSRDVVAVTLPPGLDTGSQVRVPREGHSGPFAGPRGDLIVSARVAEDPVFTRKGDNVYCELPLTLVEALLGARVTLQALDGALDLVVPPGTQSGQVFRLRGKGMPRLSSGGRGDLYVTARVEIPRHLDPRAQELVRELGRFLTAAPRGGGRRASVEEVRP